MGRRLGADKQFGVRFNGAYRDGDGPVGKQRKKVQLGSLALDWRGERARRPTCTAPMTVLTAPHVASAWHPASPFRGHRVATR